MLNILTEPLISFNQTGGGRANASLPEVYAALMTDRVDSFPSLRPHQRHAWHAFLVQLAAMARRRAELAEPPEDAEEWLRLIRGLTPDHPEDEPWQLVVDDITKPAFMQPPARSEDKLAEYKSRVATPDELDMLVTSKNHDLKAAVAAQAGVDDWLFALITLQTMAGFDGAGNFGIARMNGGLGNRPRFALAPFAQSLGRHVRRDLTALLEYRPEILAEYPMTDNGATLLWNMPWDGTAAEALLPNRLAPFFIEICRRIRLGSNADGSLYGIRATSKTARIEAKALNGQMGDPWTPVDLKGNKSLTLAAGGFTYKRVTDYLTSADWKRPVLMKADQSEKSSSETMQLVARAMVRGQGKTEGYYERSIPIKEKFRTAMQRGAGIQELGNLAKARIGEISNVQRILSHAIQVFAAGGDSANVKPEHRRLASPWLNRLDEIIDARFFDDLQTEFEADAPEERQQIRNRWLLNDQDEDGVVDYARIILSKAIDSLPCPKIHRYKARVNAEGLFEGRIRSAAGLPGLFDTTNKEVE